MSTIQAWVTYRIDNIFTKETKWVRKWSEKCNTEYALHKLRTSHLASYLKKNKNMVFFGNYELKVILAAPFTTSTDILKKKKNK